MKRTTSFVIDWCGRMTEKFGPVVTGREGEYLDWGQALARSRFGEDWVKEVRKEENFAPDNEAVEIAKRWENGEWPEWAIELEEVQKDAE